MDGNDFSKIRHFLGKTQGELSDLLCVSAKAVQSYEQGWRNIPVHIEKQMLLLLSLKNNRVGNVKHCWEIKDCPEKFRDNCIVWELKARYFCWFLNGTFCRGKKQKSWRDKIEICRDCRVYSEILPET